MPTPALPPIKPDSDKDTESPPPPSSPTKKNTHDYDLRIHVKEMIGHGPLLVEGGSSSDEDGDLRRRHTFKTSTGLGEQGYA